MNPEFHELFIEDDHADEILAKTIWGEARGESRQGKIAVGWVILNRVLYARKKGGYWWGNYVVEVCQKPYQFSCWNKNDPNREKIDTLIDNDPVYSVCLNIARELLDGKIKSPVRDATHYYATYIKEPKWAKNAELVCRIGSHFFYRNVK